MAFLFCASDAIWQTFRTQNTDLAGSRPASRTSVPQWWNGRHAALRTQCFGVGVQIPPGVPRIELCGCGVIGKRDRLKSGFFRVRVPASAPCACVLAAMEAGCKPVTQKQRRFESSHAHQSSEGCGERQALGLLNRRGKPHASSSLAPSAKFGELDELLKSPVPKTGASVGRRRRGLNSLTLRQAREPIRRPLERVDPASSR